MSHLGHGFRVGDESDRGALLEKAIEGAIIGFVGAAATELGLHMTDVQHQPQIA
jgi:hypothetical protein